MKLTNYFEISRFWLLLKVELFRSRKGVLMTFVITFGMLFFAGLLLDILVEKEKVFFGHEENYTLALMIGGFILTSLAFDDLGNTLRRSHYLTLPASAFEKFTCMWLLTSAGWIILFTIIYSFYTFIANVIGPILFRHITFQPFEPLGEYSLDTMRSYFVLQGVFLVGAVQFRGYVFPKTLFTLILFGAVCGTIAYFIMEDLLLAHECNAGECELVKRMKVHQAWVLVKWLFWWTLAPLCWVITYLGLKEQEA
jgi:hypothetical protein